MSTDPILTLPPAALLPTAGETAAELYGAGYHDRIAAALCQAATLAYLKPEEVAFRAMGARWDGGTLIERGSADVALLWSPEAIVIAGAGSAEGGDWLDNAASLWRSEWRPVLPPGVRVGRGFRSQADKALAAVVQRLTYLKQRYPDARIFVAGHSLAAATSPLLVAGLLHHAGERAKAGDAGAAWWVPACLYSFESPRVGSAAWAEWYGAEVGRVVPSYNVAAIRGGELDYVHRVPRRRWGFRHVEQRYLLDGDRLHAGEAAWQEYRRANPVGHLAAWRIVSRFRRSVQAHYIRGVLEQVQGRYEASLA